ncbi:MAG TPA: transporter, partial [Kofleriaceae bacterium]
MSENHHGDGSELSVGLSVEAASFSTSYVGTYEGVTPSLGWMSGSFGAAATIGLYHLDKNGLSSYGAGDAMLGGHAMVLKTEVLHAGVALHVMVPTGSELEGFGMGHVMVMPSAWATWRAAPFTVEASAGYGRAMADLGGHNHGGPLVDP